MKTVLDAVIDFKGEWDEHKQGGNEQLALLMHTENPEFRDDIVGNIFKGYDGFNHEYYTKVCTRNEFNALVDELASNFGECDISYQKHCSNEVTRLEGDEMKTVTHEGKAYQIGATYEFTDSDKGRHWELGILNDYASDEEGVGFQSKTGNKTEWFKHIRLQQASIGTITEAPVVLVDGECYQFTAPSGIVRKGLLHPCKGLFVCADGYIDVDRCTNIKLLTVA